jgi:hypothetical protein
MGSWMERKPWVEDVDAPDYFLPPLVSSPSREEGASLLKALGAIEGKIEDRPLNETVADVRAHFHGLN